MPEKPVNPLNRFEIAVGVIDELLPGRAFMDPLFESDLDRFKTRVELVGKGIARFATEEISKWTDRHRSHEWEDLGRRAKRMQIDLKDLAYKFEQLEIRYPTDAGQQELISALNQTKELLSVQRMSVGSIRVRIFNAFVNASSSEYRNFFIRVQQLQILLAFLGPLADARREGVPPHPFTKEALADVSLEGSGKMIEHLVEGSASFVTGGVLAIDLLKAWRHEKSSAAEAIQRVRAFIILHQIVELWESGEITSIRYTEPPEYKETMDALHERLSSELDDCDTLIRVSEGVYATAADLRAKLGES